MDKTLITKLQKAGVSADVILQLVLDEDPAPADPAPAPAPAPAPVPAPADPAPQPAAPASNDAILQAINRLTGSIQAMNLRTIGGQQTPVQTSDDILKFMMSPAAPGEGGQNGSK